LTYAYEVLTNPEKKKIYDEYGEEGLEGGLPGTGSDPFDFINRHGRQQGPRKSKSILQLIEISLTDAYNGTKRKVRITRNRICKDCNGKGGKEETITECSVCSGTGRIVKIIQMGNLIQQTMRVCDECHGRGKVIGDKCKKCNGRAVVEEQKVIELDIAKGTPDGHRFTFDGESDEYPGIEPGDVIIEVQLKKHPMFKRKGADLYMTRKITLYEALAGFNFQLQHLDGRQVVISTPPEKIIGSGEVMTVEELGMPFFGRNYKYGNLFIEFEIVFPESLTKKQMKAVRQALHTIESDKRFNPSVKEVYIPKLYEGSEKDLLAKLRKRSVDMEDEYEDEENQGAQRIECTNQ
jgi:DnaJ family protein A protein 2